MSELFDRAQAVMPGGVNSPVRSFRSIGREPVFMQRAEGSKIYDIDGNEYLDYICSWGPMILGHNHPNVLEKVIEASKNGLSFGAATKAEVEVAELMVEIVPNIEMVRMVNSGTEAVMSALRLARGYTGKNKIIKFEGCYHGHSDTMLVSAGSGALTFSNPDSSGVTKEQAQDTLIAQYNDLESVESLLKANQGQVAAVIVEPVAANMGLVPPKAGFLQGLRALCDAHETLLIFDEVITGFRLALGGAQEYYGVAADIVTFGKIIGGGMPVGAYAAKRNIMEWVAPLGPVYQAGTLSGNPVAMAAGMAQLSLLKEDKTVYQSLAQKAETLKAGLEQAAKAVGAPVSVNQVGSLLAVFFTTETVDCFAKAKTSDTGLYAIYFNKMLQKGMNLAPAQFEAMFVSSCHSKTDLEKTICAAAETFAEMKAEGCF